MEVGDFVRTKSGQIGKLIGNDVYDENQVAILIDDIKDIKITPVIDKEQIINSSPRIIDLIQVGDYVNGYKVIDIIPNFKIIIDKLQLDTSIGMYFNKNIKDKEIESIVTKEMFSSVEYRIGDE